MLWIMHSGGILWFIMMLLAMLLLVVVAAWAAVSLLASVAPDDPSEHEHDAQHTLDVRYARGEIDATEYRRRSDDLKLTSH